MQSIEDLERDLRKKQDDARKAGETLEAAKAAEAAARMERRLRPR